MDYQDILVQRRGGAAWIVINRPERMNAFRGRTKASCTDGDQSAQEGQYDGRGTIGLPMGQVNAVVPHEQLDAEVQRWCDETQAKSPTAIAIAKRSFNMYTAHQAGIAGLGLAALKLHYDTDESREGVRAFNEKRAPDFRRRAE